MTNHSSPGHRGAGGAPPPGDGGRGGEREERGDQAVAGHHGHLAVDSGHVSPLGPGVRM